MNMDATNLTPEQEIAVKHRGSALLVSAAAGSGKTKVLVERLISRIVDGDKVDEFLVITYTRAAASELRERIYDKLLDLIAVNTENRHLRRQSILCRGAPIGTIHSFCTDVLRENAYAAGISPDFRVADENESALLRTAVLEEVLNDAYETIETSEGFRALVDATLAGRDDRRLIEMVLDAHTKLQSVPNPREWVRKQIEKIALSDVSDISETEWGALLIKKTRGRVKYWRGEAAKLREEMSIHPDFDRAYGPGMDTAISGCDAFISALENGWDEAINCGAVEFPRPKPIKGYDELKSARLKCKAELEKCFDLFDCSSAEHIEDMRAVAPATTALLRLIIEFDQKYSERKRNRGVVDFSDLEHLTLGLLIDVETGMKTELAWSVSGKIKEILVDEYQDVNAIQELIFNAVSQEGKNIFMVGDVKQSIYRFRLADPSIFLRKYKSAAELRSRGQGSGVRGQGTGDNGHDETPHSTLHTTNSPLALVLLSKNFRSHAGILDFVNSLFERIMSEEFGEINYSERDRLVPGREETDRGQDSGDRGQGTGNENSQFTIHNSQLLGKNRTVQVIAPEVLEDTKSLAGWMLAVMAAQGPQLRIENEELRIERGEQGAAVEFDIIDMSAMVSDDSEENPEKRHVEARRIADRILELTNGDCLIPDGQGGKRRAMYSDIVILLRSMSGKAKRYADVLSEYGIPVDMPGSEGFFETIEVSAALSLLAVIDNPMQDVPLATVLRGPVYGFSADELAEIRTQSRGADYYSALIKASESDEKCLAFLTEIESLRALSPDMSAFKFIRHVFNKTGLLERVGSMSGGNKRRSNLVLLSEYARRFEQSGYKGLFGFLGYIRNLRENGVELTGYDSALTQDAVRIMSIHKSKGLEFPIVFLADTSKQFNYSDMYKPLVFHSELGAGINRIDRQRRIEYPTIARLAIQSKLKSEMLAEEMRILYVALTRAREKLVITATFKDAGAALAAQANSQFTIHNSQLLGTDWRIQVIPATMGGSEWREERGELERDEAEEDGESIESWDARPIDILNERFSFVYPHARAPDLPSKLTVTELKRGRLDAETSNDSELAAFAKSTGANGREFSFDKPGFIQKKTGLTAAERGTALHLAMQYIEFGKSATEDGLNSELQRFVKMGWLTETQAAAIDINKIKRLFESDIGKRLLKAENVKREFRFSLLRPAESFFPGGGEDNILLQGVVDCFFEEDGELVVIDFKTDYVTMDTLEEKTNYYAPQIAEYSEALERITGKRVKERVLYFFALDATCCV